MDFDKPKVYGDTSITDGLVFNCGHQVSSEFEFGIKENWDQINVITMEDRLDALE